MPARTAEERIEELERQLVELEGKFNALRKPRTDLHNIPKLEIDPQIPLAGDVSVISETQSAKRTDLVIGFTNPRPDLIDRFELWATNVTGQSKEPYLVASVKDSPAAFSLHASQDTSVSVGIRTITKDGLSSTLGGSPTIGTSIVQVPLGTADLADGSVTTPKIANLAVTTAKIDNLAVGTAQIDNAAITNAKIGNLAVDTAQINNAAITTAKIGTAQITTALIANAQITTALIANAAITNALIADATIASAKIVSLDAAKINAGTLNAVNISAGTYTLSSGFNSMDINGTDGFKQENSSAASRAKIFGGFFTVESTTGSEEVVLSKTGINGANTSGNTVFGLRNDVLDLGQTDSGYLGISNSSGTTKVELGVDSGGNGAITINLTKVIGAQGAAVSDASGGATVDTEARTAINTLLARLRAHGLIAT